MLHEVIDTLHEEGLDIVEARAAVAGGNPDREHEDVDAFVVRPRGKQKDFDDEKLKVCRATHTRTLRPSLTFPPHPTPSAGDQTPSNGDVRPW